MATEETAESDSGAGEIPGLQPLPPTLASHLATLESEVSNPAAFSSALFELLTALISHTPPPPSSAADDPEPSLAQLLAPKLAPLLTNHLDVFLTTTSTLLLLLHTTTTTDDAEDSPPTFPLHALLASVIPLLPSSPTTRSLFLSTLPLTRHTLPHLLGPTSPILRRPPSFVGNMLQYRSLQTRTRREGLLKSESLGGNRLASRAWGRLVGALLGRIGIGGDDGDGEMLRELVGGFGHMGLDFGKVVSVVLQVWGMSVQHQQLEFDTVSPIMSEDDRYFVSVLRSLYSYGGSETEAAAPTTALEDRLRRGIRDALGMLLHWLRQQQQQQQRRSSSVRTTRHIEEVITKVLRANLVRLEDIWDLLDPCDDVAWARHFADVLAQNRRSWKWKKGNLLQDGGSGTASDVVVGAGGAGGAGDEGEDARRRKKKKQKKKKKKNRKKKRLRSLREDGPDHWENEVDFPTGAKIRLLARFLHLGDVPRSLFLLRRLANFRPAVYFPCVYYNLVGLFQKQLDVLFRYPSDTPIDEEATATAATAPTITTVPSEVAVAPFSPHFASHMNRIVIPMAIALGPQLGRWTLLFHKYLRVLEVYLDNLPPPMGRESSEVTLLLANLLAALTTAKGDKNTCRDNVWKVLRRFAYTQRYRAYDLYEKLCRDDWVLFCESRLAYKETSLVFKQVVVESSVLADRAARLSTYFAVNPLATVGHIVQMLGYGNFVQTVIALFQIESNSLLRDALVCRLLKTMTPLSSSSSSGSAPPIEKFAEDGYTPSQHMKHYSEFIARLYHTFPNSFDLAPVFQFLLKEIQLTQWPDLHILLDILSATGEEIADALKTESLDALSGSHALRQQATFQSLVVQGKNAKSSPASISRLAHFLCSNASSMTHQLIYALAKLRKNSVLIEGGDDRSCPEPFWMVLYRHDRIHESLFLLLQFLRYHAKCVWRSDSEGTTDGDVFVVPEPQELLDAGIDEEVLFAVARLAVDPNDIASSLSRFLAEGQEFISSRLLPAPIASAGPPAAKHYILFWLLDAHDVFCPEASYTAAIEAARQQQSNRTRSTPDPPIVGKLKADLAVHRKHVEGMRRFMKTFLPEEAAVSAATFLQTCIFRRCSLTSTDALYCAHFVEVLDAVGVAPFMAPTIMSVYIRRLHEILPGWILFQTEREAIRTGRFFKTVLQFLRKRVETSRFYRGDVVKTSSALLRFQYGVHGEFERLLSLGFGPTSSIEMKKVFIRVLNEIRTEFPEYLVHGNSVCRRLTELKDVFAADDAIFKSYFFYLDNKLRNGRLKRKPPPEDKVSRLRRQLDTQAIRRQASARGSSAAAPASVSASAASASASAPPPAPPPASSSRRRTTPSQQKQQQQKQKPVPPPQQKRQQQQQQQRTTSPRSVVVRTVPSPPSPSRKRKRSSTPPTPPRVRVANDGTQPRNPKRRKLERPVLAPATPPTPPSNGGRGDL